jgi:hypothetical protein
MQTPWSYIQAWQPFGLPSSYLQCVGSDLGHNSPFFRISDFPTGRTIFVLLQIYDFDFVIIGQQRIPTSIPRSAMGQSGGSPGAGGCQRTVDESCSRLSRPARGWRERSRHI